MVLASAIASRRAEVVPPGVGVCVGVDVGVGVGVGLGIAVGVGIGIQSESETNRRWRCLFVPLRFFLGDERGLFAIERGYELGLFITRLLESSRFDIIQYQG